MNQPTSNNPLMRHFRNLPRLSCCNSTSALPVPNLELHSAAASGNLGLVHYALTHGQPVNSLLHGCLPLHAACSGGSVSVVRMLIDRGADVNAPRLPRRYSDQGKRSNNAPAVGTVGEFRCVVTYQSCCADQQAPRLYTSLLPMATLLWSRSSSGAAQSQTSQTRMA